MEVSKEMLNQLRLDLSHFLDHVSYIGIIFISQPPKFLAIQDRMIQLLKIS